MPIFGLNYKDDSAKARDWLSQLGDPYRLNIADAEGSVGLDLGVWHPRHTLSTRAVRSFIVMGVLDATVFARDFQLVSSLSSAVNPAMREAEVKTVRFVVVAGLLS